MKNRLILIAWALALGVVFHDAWAEGPPIDGKLLKETWPASWITPVDAPPCGFGVYHFRKTLALAARPERFVVHVSADNRYRLFVNGAPVSTGPAQGDLRNWRFDTVDLAPWLRQGTNVLAAVVWNGGEHRPLAQISYRTAFVLQGDTPSEKAANTDASWRVLTNRAYQPVPWRGNDRRLQWQYYCAGATERLDAKLYPRGWEQPGLDDSAWEKAVALERAFPQGTVGEQKWQLVPRPVPFLVEELQRSRRVVRSEGAEAAEPFLRGKQPVLIPPRRHATILIDHGRLTTGYPVLGIRGGAGAEISLVYAEALYDAKGRKGNRNQLDGKRIIGVRDIVLPAGPEFQYRPLWARTFRFVALEVTTAEEPLELLDFVAYECRCPQERVAVFESGRPAVQAVWDVSWRTLALAAQETFVSDLYWEHIQYVGDTKLESLSWLYTTGDPRLVRQAIEQFDQSRVPMGLTQDRYPVDLEHHTPLYSLVWVTMVHDYWMHRDEEDFVRGFLPGIEQVLGWFERRLNDEGMLGPLGWLDFVDSNYFPRQKQLLAEPGTKSLTVHSLFYAWTLDQAAELFEHFGREAEAARYRGISQRVKAAVQARCYDPQKRLLADSPAKKYFSQHANILAVLAGVAPESDRRRWMAATLDDPGLLPTELYFRFYLGRALKKAGLGDRYLEQLWPWQKMVDNGMTTFGEVIWQDPRSDCLPWAATPAYELLATVAGIEPAAPGFRRVRIEPCLGSLDHLRAVVPHPRGRIELELVREGKSGLKAKVRLPEGVPAVFRWGGREESVSGTRELQFP